MTAPDHEVFAIRYAYRTATRGGVFIGGDPHDAPIEMDYFMWVLCSPTATTVVDVGFGRAEGERRGRTFLRDPVVALALVGVDAADVRDVVITHMHYDHAGNLDLFPNARFHVQDAEMAYVTGRSMTHRALRHSFRVDDVVEMVRLATTAGSCSTTATTTSGTEWVCTASAVTPPASSRCGYRPRGDGSYSRRMRRTSTRASCGASPSSPTNR
jgi:hypothetical protein